MKKYIRSNTELKVAEDLSYERLCEIVNAVVDTLDDVTFYEDKIHRIEKILYFYNLR